LKYAVKGIADKIRSAIWVRTSQCRFCGVMIKNGDAPRHETNCAVEELEKLLGEIEHNSRMAIRKPKVVSEAFRAASRINMAKARASRMEKVRKLKVVPSGLKATL